jgi:hypothetical protein
MGWRNIDLSEEFKRILFSLGAIPVLELDKKFWRDVETPAVYLKGQRIDVNGWLSPYWAKTSIFLSDEEKEKYGIPKKPLTYTEYVSLLAVDEYETTKDPMQFAIMTFVLENMLLEEIEIQNPNDIVKVYEASIGLENLALQLLRNRLSSEEIIRLYSKRKDSNLLELLPVPRLEEEGYIKFLEDVAEVEPVSGWQTLSKLNKMNPQKYGSKLRDFIISRIRQSESFGERKKLYRTLAEIGDEKSLEVLATYLLDDPVTECREAILKAAIKYNLCSKGVVGSAVKLAKGIGAKHEPVTPSRRQNQWRQHLREYLTWVKNNNSCDTILRTDAEVALRLLR